MKTLERIVESVKTFGKAALFYGALALSPFSGGCDDGDDGPENHDPVIELIDDQLIEEGSSITLNLDDYISDPDGDVCTAELKSSNGTMVDNQFHYQDQVDDNGTDDPIYVWFRVTDGDGGEADGYFRIIQQDTYGPPIEVTPETLSSGVEALIVGNDTIGIGPFRRSQTSIAVNSKDEPLIIYFDREEISEYYILRRLNYAELKDGFWGGDIITNFWWPWGYNSVVIDSQDKAHVSFTIFTEYRGEDLYYATNKDRRWKMEQVDGNDSVGLENSIALDSMGNLHISHWAWDYSCLKYSSNDSGEWANEVLGSAAWQQTSIALDSLDNVHIAYMSGELSRHITNSSGSWEDTSVHNSSNPCLCIDSNDLLHIISRGDSFIYHSTKQSGTWQTQAVISHSPASVWADSRLSAAISNDDALMIAYIVAGTDPSNFIGKIYYATNRTGSWQEFLLDDRSVYANPSITIDTKGHPHISVTEAIDQQTGIIKYVTFDPAHFQPPIDPGDPVIDPIPDQNVTEGGLLTLNIDDYVSDPDGDPVTVELVSGPGSITNNQFSYQDQQDTDALNDQHIIQIRATDGTGGESTANFRVIQADNYYELPVTFFDGSVNWIAYAPTNFNPNMGRYPSEASVREDLRVLLDANFTAIVTYGSDYILGSVPRIAKEEGFQHVVMGIWDFSNALEWNNAINQKDHVDGYCVGNEGILTGRYTLAQVELKIDELRSLTNKPVTTTEPLSQYGSSLLMAGDWIFPNVHPYWSGVKEPNAAANWTVQQYNNIVSQKNGLGLTDKIVVMKEVGLPSGGEAVVSEANQNTYYRNLEGLTQGYAGTVFVYFEAFDQYWKDWGAVEPYWGLFNQDRSRKDVSQPQVLFAYIPPIGSTDDLQGRTVNIRPENYRISAYINKAGTWWVKPTLANSLTSILANANWTTDITTVANDEQATGIYAAIVLPGHVPIENTLPNISDPNVIAENSATR